MLLAVLLAVVWLSLSVGGRVGPPADAAPIPVPPDAAPGELLVGLRPGLPSAARAALLQDLPLTVVDFYPSTEIVRVRTDPARTAAVQRTLLHSGRVRYAEPNYRLHVADIIPNDPEYASRQAWALDLVGAPVAWSHTTGDRRVVVAILDGAVDLDHPDLAPNIWTNAAEIPANGLDDDGNGYVDDLHGYDFVGAWPGGAGFPGEDADPDAAPGDPAAGDGLDQDGTDGPDSAVGHGTRVAGIIGAVGDNGVGGAGVAWQVALMPVRVTAPEGDGYFSSFVSALEYAVANGADIANISLASSVMPLSAGDAVRVAADAGLILVAAAGNGGGSIGFPAALPEMIAVGASGGRTAPDSAASFSAWGPEVAFAAPGVEIFSTDLQAVTGTAGYATASGTSFAAPFVSGAAALILALHPAATADQVRSALRATALDLPDDGRPNWDGGEQGGGRIQIGAALQLIAAGPPAAPVITAARVDRSAVVITGTATAEREVRLFEGQGEPPAGRTLATARTQADGAFTARLSLSLFPETQARLTLRAQVADLLTPSEPSAALTVDLPRDVRLIGGWNLVAWAGPPGPDTTVLADLPLDATRVFAWGGNGWVSWERGNPLFRIPEIRTGQGLWVYLAQPVLRAWRQPRAPLERVTLASGWNLVAWPGATVASGVAVAESDAAIRALFAWEAERRRYRTFQVDTPLSTDLPMLAPLQALWVRVEGDGGLWPAP